MGLNPHQPNDVLGGRYRLVARVGQGGFGDVWRAVELFPDGTPFRDVALKLLAPELAGASWAEEAKLLASFSHPSLVTIFAAGILTESDTPFVAMEFLEGETLAEVLKRRGSLSWRAALRIARDVAAALDVIHLRGIVHLDLKPANLFVTTAGRIKVLDFGLSRTEGGRARSGGVPRRDGPAVDDASLATGVFYDPGSDPFAATQAAGKSQRAVAGTPGFVAPEVLEKLEPTAAADAYALGATMFQLVTGRLPHKVDDEPHDASNPETVRSWWLDVRDATLRGSLRDLERDGLPKGMAALTRRLLSVDPAMRGTPPGSLFRQVDEVWARPFGVDKRPYPGLKPFGSELEGTLFGRDAETQRLTRDLSFEPVLVLTGPRGAGKTSLVLAGVVPELAKSGADGKEDWRGLIVDPKSGLRVSDIVHGMRPPKRAAPAVLALSATETLESGPVSSARPRHVEPAKRPLAEDELESEASPSTAPGSDLAQAILEITNHETGVAVVIDPLEALLDLGESERRALLELIHVLAHTPRGKGIRLIATLDEHAAARVVEVCDFDAAIRGGFRYVGDPPQADAADIATGPARLAGMKVEEADLVTRDVEEALRPGGLLPFAGLALARFWDDAIAKKGSLTGIRYRELGGTKAAIIAQADATLGEMAAKRRADATELLLHLSSTDGKLAPRTLAELGVELGNDRAEVIVRELVDKHLLRWHGDKVELVDARLISWAPLETARLNAMERLAIRERLREAAEAWERSGQRREYLVTGGLLHAATSGEIRGLAPLEVDFVRECKKALKRRRMVLGVIAVMAVGIVGGLWFGERVLEQRRAEAELAQQKAENEAYLDGIIAKANRSDYRRYEKVALLVEAISKGATDPSLPVELFEAANRLAPARFLTLDSVRQPDLPWDRRWVVGQGRLGSLVVVDLEPPKGETEVDDEADMEAALRPNAGLVRKPRITELMPTDEPTIQIAPFAFDTAVVTRSTAGNLRVVRLREDGEVALAAVPPVTCRGEVVVASRAAVLACPTRQGISVWDMRLGTRREEPFAATGVALSAGGSFAAAWSETSVLLVDVGSGNTFHYDAPDKVVLARFSPREPLVAVVTARGFDIVDARTSHRVFRHEGVTFGKDDDPHPPAAARWDDGGVDLSLCDPHGEAVAYYLRSGARAVTDKPPVIGCDDRLANAPVVAHDRNGFGRLSDKEVGDHFAGGGFKLDDDRYLTRSLVLLSAHDDRLDQSILFEERTPTGVAVVRNETDTFIEVVRSGDSVAVEEPSEIAVLSPDTGVRKQTFAGAHLLGACSDGRIAAYSVEKNEYRVFDVKGAIDLGKVPREPGIVAGIAPTCDKLYTERLDGTLVRHKLASDAESQDAAKELTKLSGYVFERKASAPNPEDATTHPGLIIAASGGTIARIDAVDDSVRVIGSAVPYATALADGPGPLETVFADSTGVLIARKNGKVERVLQGNGARVWEDIAVSKARDALLLGAPDQLAVLNLSLGQVVVSSERDQVTRFAPWDSDGSLLAWSPHIDSSPRGFIIPGSVALAQRIGSLASNLRVVDRTNDPAQDGRIVLKR